MIENKPGTAGTKMASPMLQKPVRHFFNIFMQSQEGAARRASTWTRTIARTYFLDFSNQPPVQINPTKLPFRAARETIDSVFGNYIWE